MLNELMQKALLALGRETIAKRLHVAYAVPEELRTVLGESPIFREKRGAFVTLHKNGNLRGCIGYIEAIEPLAEAIREMAVAAAFRDPRFTPLTKDEFAEIDLEISVLSPVFPIEDSRTVVVGEHGLIVSYAGRRGLLLPQVPVEQGWDRETFLQHTCMKAGLPPDALEKGAGLEGFTATVFGERNDLHSDSQPRN